MTETLVPAPWLEKRCEDGAPKLCPKCRYWAVLTYVNKAKGEIVLGDKCEWCGWRDEAE